MSENLGDILEQSTQDALERKHRVSCVLPATDDGVDVSYGAIASIRDVVLETAKMERMESSSFSAMAAQWQNRIARQMINTINTGAAIAESVSSGMRITDPVMIGYDHAINITDITTNVMSGYTTSVSNEVTKLRREIEMLKQQLTPKPVTTDIGVGDSRGITL